MAKGIIDWAEEDKLAEKGEFDPPGEEDIVYAKGVLYILNRVFMNKKYPRPRGRKMPIFNLREIKAIADLIFFKPRNIHLIVYERVPRRDEITLKQQQFVKHFVSDALFNGARAARMAGYSPRSAKQIAYKLLRGR